MESSCLPPTKKQINQNQIDKQNQINDDFFFRFNKAKNCEYFRIKVELQIIASDRG